MTRARVAAGAVVLALGTAACGSSSAQPRETITVTAPAVTVTAAPVALDALSPAPSSPTPSSATPSTSRSPAPAPRGDLVGSFDALAKELSGPAGIALRGVGSDAAPLVAGPEQSDLAWSSIKVPIAVAALQREPGRGTHALARRAITVSDNGAASSLYRIAGWAAVQDEIRDGGDGATQVVHDGFFGTTTWRLEDQVRYASTLPCSPDAAPVLELMGHIAPDQRWGLGSIDGARFKGGWGLQQDGFLMRQLGIVPGPRGDTAVTIMVRTKVGMEAGSRDLTRIARWLTEHSAQLPAGRCS